MSSESPRSAWMELRKAFIKRLRIVLLKVTKPSLLSGQTSTISKEPLMKKFRPVLIEKRTYSKSLMMRNTSYTRKLTMRGPIKVLSSVPLEMI